MIQEMCKIPEVQNLAQAWALCSVRTCDLAGPRQQEALERMHSRIGDEFTTKASMKARIDHSM